MDHNAALLRRYFRWSGGGRCLDRTSGSICWSCFDRRREATSILAVGTTFSLDLLSALMLPLSFAFFDWEHEDG